MTRAGFLVDIKLLQESRARLVHSTCLIYVAIGKVPIGKGTDLLGVIPACDRNGHVRKLTARRFVAV